MISPSVKLNPLTCVPLIPLSPVFSNCMFRNDGPVVLVSEMPWPVVFWIVPPELSPPCAVEPRPVIVSPAVAPVVFSTIPLAGSAAAVALPDEMRWKVAPPAPMSVLCTLSAVADIESIVLPVPETTSVPLPVALIPAPARGVDVEAAAGERQRVAVACAHDDRVVLARVEGLGGVADDGRAAAVPGDGDAAVLLGGIGVAGLGDRPAQRDGSPGAPGDLGRTSRPVGNSPGERHVAGAAVEVEGDAGRAGDRAARGAETCRRRGRRG